MIKLVLTDMDETLLVDFHVPAVNREAIAKVRSRGVRVAAATGRSFDMVQEILAEMGTKDAPGEYSICFNGAAIYENSSARPLHYQALSYEQILEARAISDRYDLCFLAFTLDRIYMYHPSQSEIERKTRQKAAFSIETDMSLLKDAKVVKLALQSDVEEQLYAIGKKEAARFDALNIEVSYSSGRFLECTCKGVSKGSALHWLCDHLQMTTDEVMAIGDNFNDLEMIRAAGIGVAVANAPEEIRAAADIVLQADHEHDAVAEAIRQYA